MYVNIFGIAILPDTDFPLRKKKNNNHAHLSIYTFNHLEENSGIFETMLVFDMLAEKKLLEVTRRETFHAAILKNYRHFEWIHE